MADKSNERALVIDVALLSLHLNSKCREIADGDDAKYMSIYFGAMTAVNSLMKSYVTGEVGTAVDEFDRAVSVVKMGYELMRSGMADDDVFAALNKTMQEANNG